MRANVKTSGLLLFVPVTVGCAVMFADGAPVARWAVQLLGGLLGWFAYLIVRRLTAGGGAWVASRWLPWLIVGLVGSTLLTAGIEGVTRWHLVGPLRLHLSALVSPLLVVVAAGSVAARPVATGLVLTACQLVHVAQPDAGQASALGVAGAWVLWSGRTPLAARVLAIASAASGLLVWMRADPLPPAPFVEDIVPVAFRNAPLVGFLALLSMIPIVLAPLTVAREHAAEPAVSNASTGLAAYFAGTIVVPVFGEFPVPLLGFGPSPVVGAFLGLSALEVLARRAQAPTDEGGSFTRKPRRAPDAPHQLAELRA